MDEYILRDRIQGILEDQPFWIVSWDKLQELYHKKYNGKLVLCMHSLKFKEWDFCLVRKNIGTVERENEGIEEQQEEEIEIPSEAAELERELRTYKDAEEQGRMPLEAPEQGRMPLEAPEQGRMPLEAPEQGRMPLEAPVQGRMPLETREQGRMPLDAREQGRMPLEAREQGRMPVEAPECEGGVRVPSEPTEQEGELRIPEDVRRRLMDFVENERKLCMSRESIKQEKEVGIPKEDIKQEPKVRTPNIQLEKEQKVRMSGKIKQQEKDVTKPKEAMKIPTEFIKQEKEVRILKETTKQEKEFRTSYIPLEKERKVWIPGKLEKQEKDVHKPKEAMKIPKDDIEPEKGFTHPKPWLRIPIQESFTLKKKRGGSLNLKSLSNPKLPPIKLPSSNTWKIHVTKVRDFNNIRFIIMGDDYSGAQAKLTKDMIAYYKNKENRLPVKHIRVGGIYVAKDDDIWYRVQVLGLRGETVTAFVIDCGEELQLAIHDLYILHDRFWKTPQQVMTCSLAGFEFVPPHLPCIEHLEKLILGKDILAQVVSHEENISLLFMDEKNTNINQSVVSYLMKNLQTPAFPEIGDSIQVFITHVTVNGYIYFQVKTKSMDLLQNLLDVVSKQVDQIENVKEISATLCLARSGNGDWYRAIPQTRIDTDGQVLVQLVDYGVMEKVSLENLKAFDIRHLFLSNIPCQALVCQLYNVSTNCKKLSRRVYNRLQELMPLGTWYELKVRDHGYDRMPLVEIYTREGGKASCKSVNAILFVEELLSSDDDGLDFKKVTPSSTVNPDISSNESRSDDSLCSSEYESPLSYIEPVPQPKLNVGAFLQVIVIDAASPMDFAIKLCETKEDFNTLLSDMDTYYNNATNQKKSYLLDVGDFCAVHDHVNGRWLRGKITKTKGSVISGLLIDYAHHFFVSATDIQPLHSNFTSLAWQAVRAKLFGISPKDLDWTAEDCEKFRERVWMKPFVTSVLDTEYRDSEPIIVLKLIDVSTHDHDEYIDNFLVEMGIAVRTRGI